MTNSLFSRLWLSITFTIVLLVSALWAWFNYSQIHSQNLVQQSLHKKLAEHMAHINPLLSQGVTADEAIKEAFHDFMLLGPSFEIYTLDKNGIVISFAAKDSVIKQREVPLKPIHQFLNESPLPIYNVDPRGHGHKIFSAIRLFDKSNNHTGFLYVIIGGEKFDAWQSLTATSHNVTQLAIVLILIVIAVSTVFALLIQFFISPTKKLAHSLSQLNVDSLGKQLQLNKPARSSIEISELTNDINVLLSKINTQHQQITSSHEAKHEFLLHLSHDLKTPLSVLLGYIETWLASPEQERQDKWIEISAQSGEKLKGLLTQLLELAAIENNLITPNIVNFQAVELFEELALMYRHQAESRKIQANIHCPNNIEMMTDINLLRRILCNLLDNAFRYTPHGGVIEVMLIKENNQTFIKVNDSGPGISETNIHALTNKNTTHYSGKLLPELGVGLSIVKKLSELLNLDIHIENKAEGGTCFQITLRNN
ncbi:HAMP domain-containing histidine kinase [Shewanella sp. 202IG2-18]|uniref:sensor histidine kinase n=1 Tax=Parashewanella hymeniacidonis TaxID=2807618 RepID=UPI0019607764|nr:HAMP domain-containing sensor histidine kinase [Parashewanella hymeniacidonis]MBM7073558.1 HAMP domain-containing histidine kinase [Parashewanella hymeniacidonis]